MIRPLVGVAILVLLPSAVSAQEVVAGPVQLREVGNMGGLQENFGFYHPVRCDSEGNIYFRVGLNEGIDKNPVWKYSSTGKKLAEFYLPSEIGRAVSPEFNVSPSGDFYEITHGDNGVFVLKFGGDGQLSSKTRIETSQKDFEPGQFAVFSTGEVLLTGGQRREKGQWFSVAAIYGANGELIRPLNLREKSQPDLPISSVLPSEFHIAMGSDGYAYILSGSRILVVAPSGEIHRAIKLAKPDVEHFATRVDVSGGVLSVKFIKIPKNRHIELRFRTYDALTGDLLAEYVPAPELGNTQLCFSADEGYLFWRLVDKRPRLVRAWYK